jgi:hypothetical protein
MPDEGLDQAALLLVKALLLLLLLLPPLLMLVRPVPCRAPLWACLIRTKALLITHSCCISSPC